MDSNISNEYTINSYSLESDYKKEEWRNDKKYVTVHLLFYIVL